MNNLDGNSHDGERRHLVENLWRIEWDFWLGFFGGFRLMEVMQSTGISEDSIPVDSFRISFKNQIEPLMN
jgi:hypothetical protein